MARPPGEKSKTAGRRLAAAIELFGWKRTTVANDPRWLEAVGIYEDSTVRAWSGSQRSKKLVASGLTDGDLFARSGADRAWRQIKEKTDQNAACTPASIHRPGWGQLLR